MHEISTYHTRGTVISHRRHIAVGLFGEINRNDGLRGREGEGDEEENENEDKEVEVERRWMVDGRGD